MVKELVKIHYSYYYVDDKNGNYEDILYMAKNDFISYTNNESVKRIIDYYFDETDLSKKVKEIIKVEMLGKRLF